MRADLLRRRLTVAVWALALGGCETLMSGPRAGGANATPGGGASGAPGNGAVARQSHEGFFPIAAGAHGSSDCNGCHGGLPTFKMFACVGCHEHQQPIADTQHAGIAGYMFDSTSCLMCHPSGQAGAVSRADHDRFFPIDVGTKHASGQCADCHTNAADRKQFSCLGCHDHSQAVTDPKHTKVTGYQYDSPACLKCHAGGATRFDHATLGANPNCVGCHQDALSKAVTTPASKHVANGFPAACESCHRSFTAWGPGTPMQHQAVGGTTAKCQSCHLANFTAAVTPFNHVAQRVSAETCNTCHVDFTTWNTFVHNPASCYNGATRRPHEKATCVQCHATPGDYKQTSCTACHRDRGKSCDN